MAPIFQSWQNQNRYRRYPFVEDAVVSTVEDPEVSLPDSLVVDMAISVPIVVNAPGLVSAKTAGVELSALMYSGPRLVFFFAAETGDQLATATIANLELHKPGTTYDVYGVGDYSDVRGSITLGALDDLKNSVPPGAYTFSGARLEMSVVRPVLRGVRSISIGAGTALSDPLYGAVRLIEGSNIRLTYIREENAIRIDAVRNEGFNEDCECQEAVESSNNIRSINGVNATNFSITGDNECVEVSVEGNVIKIKDKCSFPCCGCDELEFVTTRLKMLETAMSKVESFAETLSTVVPASVAALKIVSGTGGTVTTTSIPV